MRQCSRLAPEKTSYRAIPVECCPIDLDPTQVGPGKSRETPTVVCGGRSHRTQERRSHRGSIKIISVNLSHFVLPMTQCHKSVSLLSPCPMVAVEL